jgi:hypothetical protein
MSKFISRKLAITLCYGLLVALNGKLGLNITENVLMALAGAVSTYLVAQGYVDSKTGDTDEEAPANKPVPPPAA